MYPQHNKYYVKILESEDPEDFSAPKYQQGGSKIMVWGAISGSGQVHLGEVKGKINAKTYCEFLEGEPLQAIRKKCPLSSLFMQDNAKPHAAKDTLSFLEDEGLKVLEWPPQSPDLNPIEQVWGWMVMQMRDMTFKSIKDIRALVRELWEKIPKETILAYIHKIPSKMEYIKTHNGDLYSERKDKS